MSEIYHHNPDAMKAELAYRRSLLMGPRGALAAPRGRGRLRRGRRTV